MTINVVTKRGTNELKGSARYLYASGNWQSNNTPQEAHRPGTARPTARGYIREYGADLGGPIVKDRLWLWSAGLAARTISPEPDHVRCRRRISPTRETTNLEPWSAKLNCADLQRELGRALLPAKRPDSVRTAARRRTVRPRRGRSSSIPTNFYKVEDSNVFSSDLFGSIFATYQNPDYTTSATVARLRAGACDRDDRRTYYDDSVPQHTTTTTMPRTRRSRPTSRSRSSSTRAGSTTS